MALPAGRALMLSWALVPLVFMPAVGVAFGADLQLQWGTAFLAFAVPAAMEWVPRGVWRRVRPAIALRSFVALQGLLLAISYATSPRGFELLRDHHWRTFDSARLAGQVAAPARSALGGPIRLVIGDAALAGALALALPERPLVLVDGQSRDSPRVVSDLLRRCGALELILASAGPADAAPVGRGFVGLYWRSIRPSHDGAPCR